VSLEVSASTNVFLGAYKPLNDVQDKKGKISKNPLSPALSIGKNFQLMDRFGFSPQLGYIYHSNHSDDSYGKYTVRTIFLLYDFIWVPEMANSLALRFGVGNFIKSVEGEGGQVTIPNGSGTASATRPSGKKTSYSNTFNFGADWNWGIKGDWFENVGLRFETFVFRPLSKDYRNYAFNVGMLIYF